MRHKAGQSFPRAVALLDHSPPRSRAPPGLHEDRMRQFLNDRNNIFFRLNYYIFKLRITYWKSPRVMFSFAAVKRI